MLERIIDILSKYTEYDKSKMNADTSLVVDLGLTSLEVIKIILDLEEEFEVEFPEDDLENITTIGDIEAFIQNL